MKKIPKSTLIFDISNILFRVSAVQKISPHARDASPEDLVGLCMHISLMSIIKWYNKFKPEFVVFAFEGGNNWRKEYTKKHSSRLQYKGNRVVDPEMAHFYELINAFKTTIKENTSICCLSIDTMEADDAIAGYCQLYAGDDHEIMIVSGDKDFIQLLKLPNVYLVNPDNGKLRNQVGDKDYQEDIDYWLFLKCIRGDGGDNVPSAYPRVRETKIKKAYENDYDRANFLNETWVKKDPILQPDGSFLINEETFKVGDLYKENVVLLDLYSQPPEQRKLLEEGIKQQVNDLGTYSHFKFLKFLHKFDLQRIADDSKRFIDMFVNNQNFMNAKNEPEKKSLLSF